MNIYLINGTISIGEYIIAGHSDWSQSLAYDNTLTALGDEFNISELGY